MVPANWRYSSVPQKALCQGIWVELLIVIFESVLVGEFLDASVARYTSQEPINLMMVHLRYDSNLHIV
jgi:hypothetical protein